MALICMCGFRQGYHYEHEIFCPYPYFGGDPKKESEWLDAYRKLRRKIALEYPVEDETDEHVLDLILQELNEAVDDETDELAEDEK
jgi:hypothetical protein